MITLCFVVLAVFGVFCIIKLKDNDTKDFDGLFALTIVSLIISFFLLVTVIEDIGRLATAHTIDESIEMYEEENSRIEELVAVTVREYLDHEDKTYQDMIVSNENAVVVAQAYPELQSNTLVQQQIEVYIQNNQKIKELRQEKIDLAMVRWNLYFGM